MTDPEKTRERASLLDRLCQLSQEIAEHQREFYKARRRLNRACLSRKNSRDRSNASYRNKAHLDIIRLNDS
jgi:hypothetical protein